VRILVDRLWPRGLSKARAPVDYWAKAIAPSTPLRRWYGHEAAKWEEFRRRYFAELDANPAGLAELRQHLSTGTVTLLYGSREDRLNNATVLQAYLTRHGPGAGSTASPHAQRRLSAPIVAAISKDNVLRIRAGTEPHRFIGIWVVVVERRVFVRSWTLKPGGWYRTLLERPQGAIQLGDREIPVRAVRTKSARLMDAVDRAYLEKYNTPGAVKYARDLARPKSRATTTELVPW
jgi:uncharacterized protein YeaO (DUF488 family)